MISTSPQSTATNCTENGDFNKTKHLKMQPHVVTIFCFRISDICFSKHLFSQVTNLSIYSKAH